MKTVSAGRSTVSKGLTRAASNPTPSAIASVATMAASSQRATARLLAATRALTVGSDKTPVGVLIGISMKEIADMS